MNGQATILVVDDEPANIEALAAVLEDQYEVQFSLSGPAALTRARTKPRPDLILLDAMMPDMDGYAVCAQLKADRQTADIPIIFVTALSAPDEVTRGLDAGAVDYITRPYSPAIVCARVRNHLEILRTRELLHRLAMTDSLTGLANRRQFDDALTHEIQRVWRRQEPLSLILIDVDHFKAYNDHYGHPAGDGVLRALARTLASALQRPADLAARMGGEEFACLLPETESEGAWGLAEKIRAAVESLCIVHAYSDVAPHLTISLGVATLTAYDNESALRLYQQADTHLYAAKLAGRNRVAAARS